MTEDAPKPAPDTMRMGYEGKAFQAQASLGEDLWELHAAASKLTEFTAGRTFADFEASEVLRAATASMLVLMAAATARIARQSPEITGRLAAAGLPELTAPEVSPQTVWRFIEEGLPALLANATVELEAWHDA